ncbi:MAG: extracellular solute-binding protein [Deltaproteobacteria bacterium]|nr:extracellular solute-binding protein [Deltaproteobacteria bacterium]
MNPKKHWIAPLEFWVLFWLFIIIGSPVTLLANPKQTAGTSKLPQDLVWENGSLLPEYVDPKAKRGGTYYTSVSTYPLTFRLYGPNANSGGFAILNHELSNWSLTSVHPVTRKVIPQLATHWAIMPDQRTVYYKLDRDARWSDGKPITADDYLFALEFQKSKHIQAPFYNQYVRDYFQSIEKIEDYIIKVTSVKPSWRILYELDLSPQPRHFIKLDKNWVKDYNWKANVVPGPYVLKEYRRGKYLIFERVKNWWGDNKARYKSRFNFDRIHARVVRTREIEFELFKKGKLDVFSVSDGNRWFKQTNFKDIQKGYIQKQLIYVDVPAGIRGIFLNTKDPLLKDIQIRLALNHILDFKTINQKFLYGLEKRQNHFFDTYPPYRHPGIKSREFDLQKANQLLDKAGWGGPRDNAGIRQKQGVPLSITVSTGSEVWVKYLAFIKETALKAGIDLQIKVLDGAALFKSFNERTYQSIILVYTGGQFPGPRQFLHTENIKKGTNNLFQFGTKGLDELIETYEFDLNEKKRIDAIFKIEEIVKENAIWIPFWRKDHSKLLWWRYIKGPSGFITPTGFDLSVLWYDEAAVKSLKDYQEQNKAFDLLPTESDPFHVNKP